MPWNDNGMRKRDLLLSLIQMHNVDIAVFQEARLDNEEIDILRNDARQIGFLTFAFDPVYRPDGSVYDGNVISSKRKAKTVQIAGLDDPVALAVAGDRNERAMAIVVRFTCQLYGAMRRRRRHWTLLSRRPRSGMLK